MISDWVAVIAVPAAAIIAAWITARVTRRQVNVQAAQVTVEATEGDRRRIKDLEQRVDLLETDRESDRDYIGVLKNHIWERRDPPPPARPSRSTRTAPKPQEEPQ